MEQQFSDTEKRFVLAEAIKSSTIAVERLYQVLAEYNVSPDWEQMLLPNGRNIAQCKQALDSLRHAPPPGQVSTPHQPYPHTFLNPVPGYSVPSGNKRQSVNLQPGPEVKRPRKSGAETPTLTRELLPKTVDPNGGSPMSTMASSPAATTSQKKRGRPSKADVERKQREAIARGEVIPPGPQTSSQAGMLGQDDSRPGYSPVTILPAPPGQNLTAGNPQRTLSPAHSPSPQVGMGHGSENPITSTENPGKKKKPRLPSKPKASKPGEHQFSINPPTGQEESPFTPASTEGAPAGPTAAPAEVGDPPPSTTPAATQDPAPKYQPTLDDK